MITVSNETVHPVTISVDMRLGSIVPYIHITDNFGLKEGSNPWPSAPSIVDASDTQVTVSASETKPVADTQWKTSLPQFPSANIPASAPAVYTPPIPC